MKPKSFEKELVLSETPTKEMLEEARKDYKPVNWKDTIITTMLHDYALTALDRGAFEEPGVYRLGVEFFPKGHLWTKVRLYVRKIS